MASSQNVNCNFMAYIEIYVDG